MAASSTTCSPVLLFLAFASATVLSAELSACSLFHRAPQRCPPNCFLAVPFHPLSHPSGSLCAGQWGGTQGSFLQRSAVLLSVNFIHARLTDCLNEQAPTSEGSSFVAAPQPHTLRVSHGFSWNFTHTLHGGMVRAIPQQESVTSSSPHPAHEGFLDKRRRNPESLQEYQPNRVGRGQNPNLPCPCSVHS